MRFPIVENVRTSSDIIFVISRGLQLPYRENIQKEIVQKTSFFFDFCLIRQLEASRCVQNDVRGCANIFHYRKPHSENFTFSTIFDPPPGHLGGTRLQPAVAGGGVSRSNLEDLGNIENQDRQNPYR